jgi:hypothetical protein
MELKLDTAEVHNYTHSNGSIFSVIDLTLLKIMHTEDGVVLLCTGDPDITERFFHTARMFL